MNHQKNEECLMLSYQSLYSGVSSLELKSAQLTQKSKNLYEDMIQLTQKEKELTTLEILLQKKESEYNNVRLMLFTNNTHNTKYENVLDNYLLFLQNNNSFLNNKLEETQTKDNMLFMKEFILDQITAGSLSNENKIHQTISLENKIIRKNTSLCFVKVDDFEIHQKKKGHLIKSKKPSNDRSIYDRKKSDKENKLKLNNSHYIKKMTKDIKGRDLNVNWAYSHEITIYLQSGKVKKHRNKENNKTNRQQHKTQLNGRRNLKQQHVSSHINKTDHSLTTIITKNKPVIHKKQNSKLELSLGFSNKRNDEIDLSMYCPKLKQCLLPPKSKEKSRITKTRNRTTIEGMGYNNTVSQKDIGSLNFTKTKSESFDQTKTNLQQSSGTIISNRTYQCNPVRNGISMSVDIYQTFRSSKAKNNKSYNNKYHNETTDNNSSYQLKIKLFIGSVSKILKKKKRENLFIIIKNLMLFINKDMSLPQKRNEILNMNKNQHISSPDNIRQLSYIFKRYFLNHIALILKQLNENNLNGHKIKANCNSDSRNDNSAKAKVLKSNLSIRTQRDNTINIIEIKHKRKQSEFSGEKQKIQISKIFKELPQRKNKKLINDNMINQTFQRDKQQKSNKRSRELKKPSEINTITSFDKKKDNKRNLMPGFEKRKANEHKTKNKEEKLKIEDELLKKRQKIFDDIEKQRQDLIKEKKLNEIKVKEQELKNKKKIELNVDIINDNITESMLLSYNSNQNLFSDTRNQALDIYNNFNNNTNNRDLKQSMELLSSEEKYQNTLIELELPTNPNPDEKSESEEEMEILRFHRSLLDMKKKTNESQGMEDNIKNRAKKLTTLSNDPSLFDMNKIS